MWPSLSACRLPGLRDVAHDFAPSHLFLGLVEILCRRRPGHRRMRQCVGTGSKSLGGMERFSTPAGTPGCQLISTLSHLFENRSVGIRNETRRVGESLMHPL